MSKKMMLYPNSEQNFYGHELHLNLRTELSSNQLGDQRVKRETKKIKTERKTSGLRR
jgi:hypothetical protein